MSDPYDDARSEEEKKKQDAMGKAGEAIMRERFRKIGWTVEETIDPFDHEKDMIVNGEKVEIKTQRPYVTRNCVSVKHKQLDKFRKCDWVYFVTVPGKRYDDICGKIYRLDPKNMVFFTYGKWGKRRAGFDVNQEAMKLVGSLTAREIEVLERYGISGW